MLTRAGDKLRVLIIEDNALIALDLQHMIEEMGGVVLGLAVAAEHGLELARASQPDLVLMDVRLAGVMDGIEAAEAIKTIPGTALVFVTGNTDAQTMARIRRAGDYIVLPKPVLAIDLEAAMRTACRIEPRAH